MVLWWKVLIQRLLVPYTFVYTETTAFGCVASCEFTIVVNPHCLYLIARLMVRSAKAMMQ
jgi:hypothetical protein